MDYAVRTYPLGWVPNADEVNGPEGCLLRADNLIMDELGVVSVRQGSETINSSPFSDTDVHSLFTVVRSGTRLRYAGANSAVYRNGSSVISGVDGSGDISFGSHMGQTLIARGTTKKKDDGTTVRNLGIAMTGGAPSIQAALSPNTKQIAAWDLAETADHVWDEDDGNGVAYNQDHDGTPDGAVVLRPSVTTLKGLIRRTFSGDTDFSQYTGPIAGADTDILQVWVFMENSSVVKEITMFIDINDGSFQLDYYFKTWDVGGTSVSGATLPGGGEPAPNDPGSDPSDPPMI